MWDDQNREALLGNNDVFLNEYCSEHTRKIIENAGWNNQNSITKIRKAISILTRLMPDASHRTPIYLGSADPNLSPLIICARRASDFSLIGTRIGLCIKNDDKNKIFFSIQQSTIEWLSNLKTIPPIISPPEYAQIDAYKSENKDQLPPDWEFVSSGKNNTKTDRVFRFPFNVKGTWRDALESLNADIKEWQDENPVPIDSIYQTAYPKFIQIEGDKRKVSAVTGKTFVTDEKTAKQKNNEEGAAMTKLNTILYGPPGTGKTFNTINEALKIIDSKFWRCSKFVDGISKHIQIHID